MNAKELADFLAPRVIRVSCVHFECRALSCLSPGRCALHRPALCEDGHPDASVRGT
jgi:hypothetical protein